MFARALIVVLIALNLGVAAWWWLRPAPVPPVAPVSDQGGVALRLLPAQATPVETVPVADATTTAADTGVAETAAANAQTCLRIGPFNGRAAAEAARTQLDVVLRDPQLREEPGQASRHRVLLPPVADRAQAQAIAARITEAGFDDLFVLSQGTEANGIALGTYGSRDTAERRAAALRAAGFPVQVHAQGTPGASRWWLLGASDDPAAVRAAFPAAQEHDCAAMPIGALR